jgi:hypothetical protein
MKGRSVIDVVGDVIVRGKEFRKSNKSLGAFDEWLCFFILGPGGEVSSLLRDLE